MATKIFLDKGMEHRRAFYQKQGYEVFSLVDGLGWVSSQTSTTAKTLTNEGVNV